MYLYTHCPKKIFFSDLGSSTKAEQVSSLTLAATCCQLTDVEQSTEI